MNLEEVGRIIDREVTDLVDTIDGKIKELTPVGRKKTAKFLREASERLSALAENLEKKTH